MEFPNIIWNNSFLCNDKCLKIGYNKLSDLCNQIILNDGGQMIKKLRNRCKSKMPGGKHHTSTVS